MLNPENKKTPEKAKMTAVNSGPKSETQVIKESSVYEKILPFIYRGLSVREILSITAPAFSGEQIENALCRESRSVWYELPLDYFSPEKVTERRRACQTPGQPKRLIDRKPSEDYLSTIEFLHEAWKLGLFTKDDSVWRKLHALYNDCQRGLPENIFDKLRLEIYLSAMLLAESDLDPVPLNNYKELVSKIASASFAYKLFFEEQFIKRKVCKVWIYDGEDDMGLYSYDRNGGKAYTFTGAVDEKGKPIYETSEGLRRKRRSREWNEKQKERSVVKRYDALMNLNPPEFSN